MAEAKKYYWLKLNKDFFKRHDMRFVEEMPNGKDYVLFYLKLLLESVDHEGELRFSDTIPYNEQMLSVITNTNIDIVRSAMKVFVELNMVSICDDQTIYMNAVGKLIGSAADNDNANRQRRFREKKKETALLERYDSVTNRNESKSKRIDIDIDIESVTPKQSSRFVPPTLDEVKEYCRERGNNVDAEMFIDHYTANGWLVGGKSKMKDWKASVRTWERNDRNKEPKPSAASGSFDTDDFFEAALVRSKGGGLD